MKTFRVKALFVLCFSVLFCRPAEAQTVPVNTFPYQAEFGTTDAPGTHNDAWKFYSFAADFTTRQTSSSWSFGTQPDLSGLAPRFQKRNDEFVPSAFTPCFSLEKSASASYILTVSYSVAEGQMLDGDNLVVRLTAADDDGEPLFPSSFVLSVQQPQITDNGKTVSVLLKTHVPADLHTGISSYSYTVSAEQIPQSGNYRFSFHVAHAAKSLSKATPEFYITSLKVEKNEGMDMAAGQIQSPYSAPDAGVLPFSAFVRNAGAATVNDFTAAYQVDDNPAVRQNFSDMNMESGQIRAITFGNYPDLSQGDHRIRFWIESDQDLKKSNDTSAFYYVRAGQNALASLPATFNFYGQARYGWTAYSDSVYTSPSWNFVEENGYAYPYTSTEKENEVRNNDYIVSPLMQMDAYKIYRIEFAYKAVLPEGKQMGDKSLSLLMCNGVDRTSVTAAASRNKIWSCERFDDKGERNIVLYYHSRSKQNRALAFLSNGPFSEGGLQLTRLSIKEAETNPMDFFCDFEAATLDQATNNTRNLMDLVDQDGNLEYGKTGNWEVDNNRTGFNNSTYSLRSPGVSGKTNDWIVLKPFRLEAGTDYYLIFQARMISSKSGSLEVYVGQDAPGYDLDFNEQTGLKWQMTVSRQNYDTVRRVFKVEESGLYMVAIRNTTEVKPDAGTFQENEAEANFTLYIDNISLSSSERNSVQATSASVPYEAALGQSVGLTMTVRNHAWVTMAKERITYCYQIDEAGICREPATTGIAAQDADSYSFQTRASFNATGDQEVKFWVETAGSSDPIDTIRVKVTKFIAAELPFVEDFSEASWAKWQVYPASRSVWNLTHGTASAHSGEWALKCGGNTAVNDYAVTPLLKVQQGKTYRISFFYKRDAASAAQKDSIGIYYEYDRYDLTGFRQYMQGFDNITESDYTYCEAFVRFPEEGNVFIGIKASLTAQSPALYIDDFSIMDSTQSEYTSYSLGNPVVNGILSECDTMPVGRFTFSITTGGSAMDEEIPLFVRYDDSEPQDISFSKNIASGTTFTHQIEMPMFSGGEHQVQVWLAFPHEVNRTDDTVACTFTVAEPASMPFAAEDMSIVGQARMTACFEVEEAGQYKLHYVGDATQAVGGSLRVSLLHYGHNTVQEAAEIETVQLTGSETKEKSFSIAAPGVYALGFEGISLPEGGVLHIKDLRLESNTANRMYAHQEISLRPNPAADRVRVHFPENAERLILSDLQGRVLRRLDLDGLGNEAEVSLQGLQPGIYLVRIESEANYGIVKLIKR